MVKTIAVGDTISGKTVTGLNFTRGGLFGDPIAFQATFADGSHGIFTRAVVAPPFKLRITGVEKIGNNLRLSFPSLFGSNYAAQSHAELSSGAWTTVPGTTSFGTGGTLQITLTNALGQPRQFYWVKPTS